MKFKIAGKEIEISNEDLTKAIEANQESLEVQSDFVVRTPSEESTFVENIKGSGNSAAYEIGRKNVLKGLGIEVEGQHKSDESAINAVKSHIETLTSKALDDAKIEPDKKVQELLNDKKTLSSTIETLQGEKKSLSEQFTTYKQDQTRRSTLSELIPDNTLNDKKTTMLIMEAQLKTSFDDNGNMFGIGMDGQPLKDPTTANVLPMKDVVNKFFDNNPQLLKPVDGGAGGSDSIGGSGKMSLEEFTKQQTDAGNEPNGEKFIENLTSAIDAGTVDM